MATFIVEWSSTTKLPCAGCVPEDVILCTVRNDLPIVYAKLIGSRIDTSQRKHAGGQTVYVYRFSYINDNEGFVPLTCREISGALCRGCLTKWIEAILPTPVQVYNEIVYQATRDFIADPVTPVVLSLVVTNPSVTQAMKAQATWGWTMHVDNSQDVFLDPNSLSGQIDIDGTPISTFVNQTITTEIPGGPVIFDMPANGAHPFIVNEGTSNVITLTITPHRGTNLPGNAWRGDNMYVAVYGVTQ